VHQNEFTRRIEVYLEVDLPELIKSVAARSARR